MRWSSCAAACTALRCVLSVCVLLALFPAQCSGLIDLQNSVLGPNWHALSMHLPASSLPMPLAAASSISRTRCWATPTASSRSRSSWTRVGALRDMQLCVENNGCLAGWTASSRAKPQKQLGAGEQAQSLARGFVGRKGWSAGSAGGQQQHLFIWCIPCWSCPMSARTWC